MENNFWLQFFDQCGQCGCIADIAKMTIGDSLNIGQFKQVWHCRRGQANAGDLGTESVEPEGQPAALEAGVAGE